MVDYNEEAQAKHHRMQAILADLRKQTETPAATVADTAKTADDGAENDPPSSSPTLLVPPDAIRLAVGADALAIEVLDRTYPQCRATFQHLAPRTVGHLDVVPSGPAPFLPKAWSIRVRDSIDAHVRRSAMLRDVVCCDLRQMRLDTRVGIETDEFEADYYRIALENGKEATLVARDISGFSVFSKLFPLELAFFNPSDLHCLDILVKVWGEEGPSPP